MQVQDAPGKVSFYQKMPQSRSSLSQRSLNCVLAVHLGKPGCSRHTDQGIYRGTLQLHTQGPKLLSKGNQVHAKSNTNHLCPIPPARDRQVQGCKPQVSVVSCVAHQLLHLSIANECLDPN